MAGMLSRRASVAVGVGVAAVAAVGVPLVCFYAASWLRLRRALSRVHYEGGALEDRQPAMGLSEMIHNFEGYVRQALDSAQCDGKLWVSNAVGAVKIGVLDLPLVTAILNTRDSAFSRTWADVPVMQQLFGCSIIAANGKDWSRQHRIMARAFSQKRLRGSLDIILRHTRATVGELLERRGPGRPVEVGPAMNKLTLQIIVSIAFGSSLTPEEHELVFESTRVLLDLGFHPVNLTPLRHLPFFKVARDTRRALRTVQEVAATIIERRRAVRREHAGDGAGGAGGVPDLIDMLLSAVDEDTNTPLSDEEVRDNVVTFLLAGSETTAGAATWVIYALQRNPDVAQRVEEELRAVDVDPDTFTMAVADSLPYLESVVRETMRRYAPVLGLPHRQVGPTGLDVGGIRFDPGCRLFINTWSLHLSPALFPDPYRFDPTRFSAATTDGSGGAPAPAGPRLHNPPGYMPFGAGRRTCIGRFLAEMELRVIMPLLLSQVDFGLDPASPEPRITLTGPTVVPAGLTAICRPKAGPAAP